MTAIVIGFVLIVGAVIQAVIPALAWIGPINVPILLGIVVYFSLTRSLGFALCTGFMAGLLQDALSLIPLGYSSFCFCLAGGIINRFRDVVFVYQGVTHFLLGAVSNTSVVCILTFLLAMSAGYSFLWEEFTMRCVGAIFLGGIMVPLIFRCIKSLEVRIGSLEMGAS